MKRVAMVLGLIAIVSSFGCKKKSEDGAAPTPDPAAAPTTPTEPAAAPTTEPAPPEEPKTTEPTPPVEPPASPTQVKGTTKEKSVELKYAYVFPYGSDGTSWGLRLYEKEQDGGADCKFEPSADGAYVEVGLATGPKGDFFGGKPIPGEAARQHIDVTAAADALEAMPTLVTIAKFDAAAKTVEGTLVFWNPQAAGEKVEGPFVAQICWRGGTEVAVAPSMPLEAPEAPLAWKVGARDLTLKTAIATKGANGEWNVVLSSGDVACGDLEPKAGDHGFTFRTFATPELAPLLGSFYPAWGVNYYLNPADHATKADTVRDSFTFGTAAIELTSVGEGEGAKLAGALAFHREYSFYAATEGDPDVTLLTTGGGTFEAQICP